MHGFIHKLNKNKVIKNLLCLFTLEIQYLTYFLKILKIHVYFFEGLDSNHIQPDIL